MVRISVYSTKKTNKWHCALIMAVGFRTGKGRDKLLKYTLLGDCFLVPYFYNEET